MLLRTYVFEIQGKESLYDKWHQIWLTWLFIEVHWVFRIRLWDHLLILSEFWVLQGGIT